MGTNKGRRGAGTDQCNSHNNQKAAPGTEHSISPDVPCPQTVLVAAMTDSSSLLMAYPNGEHGMTGPTSGSEWQCFVQLWPPWGVRRVSKTFPQVKSPIDLGEKVG